MHVECQGNGWMGKRVAEVGFFKIFKINIRNLSALSLSPLLQKQLLKTTRGVCLSVVISLSVSISFFAIYSKNLQATNTCKFVTLLIIFSLYMFYLQPPEKKNLCTVCSISLFYFL